MSDHSLDVETTDAAGPIELGMYSIDELAALAPGRVDLLDGDQADPAAGARALLAGGRMQLATGLDGTLAGVPTEAAAVVARFLTDPERTIVVRVDDLFGTDQYVLHGQAVDDAQCYVLEGGTRGVRRLIFVLDTDAPAVIAELTGLDELAEAVNLGEAPRDVEIDSEPADSPLGKALAQPVRSVTLSAGRPGAELIDISFVHGEDAAWLIEWTGESTARVSPLDGDAVSASLARVLA